MVAMTNSNKLHNTRQGLTIRVNHDGSGHVDVPDWRQVGNAEWLSALARAQELLPTRYSTEGARD